VIPAVANAVHDALGVRIDETPITPEKVVAALEGRYRAPQMPAFRYPESVKVDRLDPSSLPRPAAQEAGR
jgi:hypothetical protein